MTWSQRLSGHRWRPALAAAALLGGAAAAVLNWQARPGPLDRLRAALFVHPREVKVPACSLTRSCGALDPDLAYADAGTVRLTLGGEEPLPVLDGEVDYLTEPPRRAELERAIAAAMELDPARSPIEAVLAQAEAWQRFDAVLGACGDGPCALDWLLTPLARLIHHLALPPRALAAIAPNAREVAQAYPELLPGFATGEGWSELGAEEGGLLVMRHATAAGQRLVFRSHVRPVGTLPLALHQRVGDGTRLVLVCTPLAIASDGTLHEVPLWLTVDVRVAGSAPVSRVRDLRYASLHASRAHLAATPRVRGGVEPVPAEQLLQHGGGCMPDPGRREPLQLACSLCHGRDGNLLIGPASGEQGPRLVLNPGADAAGASVIARKQRSDQLAALLRRW